MFVARIIRNDGYILDKIGVLKPFRELNRIREKCREVMISKARSLGYSENQAHDCLYANIYETSSDTQDVVLIDTVKLLEEDKVYADDEENDEEDDDWNDEDEDEENNDNNEDVNLNAEPRVNTENLDRIVAHNYPWNVRPAQDIANIRVAQHHDELAMRVDDNPENYYQHPVIMEELRRRMNDMFGVNNPIGNLN